jgi:hypothetical protein
MVVLFDMRFQQTAFEQCGFFALTCNATRAHFDSWGFVPVEVAVELQAALAPNHSPILTFWTLVQEIHRRR